MANPKKLLVFFLGFFLFFCAKIQAFNRGFRLILQIKKRLIIHFFDCINSKLAYIMWEKYLLI